MNRSPRTNSYNALNAAGVNARHPRILTHDTGVMDRFRL